MTWLLDGNVLIALTINTHVFHERAWLWFDRLKDPFATCSITEGTLLRLHMKLAANTSAEAAWATLAEIHQMPDYEYWNDSFSYLDVKHDQLKRAAQVTDAWLAELARRKGGKLATFDREVPALYADVGVLIP